MKENLIVHKSIEQSETIVITQKYVVEYYKSKLLNSESGNINKRSLKSGLQSMWNISSL